MILSKSSPPEQILCEWGLLEYEVYVNGIFEGVIESQYVGVFLVNAAYQRPHNVNFGLKSLCVGHFLLRDHLDSPDDVGPGHCGLEYLSVCTLAQLLPSTPCTFLDIV